MIDMFTNYQNLSDSYIPNNLSKYQCKPESYTKLCPVENSKPYEHYDAKGNLDGYFWHHGDTINLDFTIEGEVIINNDSHITAEDFLKDKSYTFTIYNHKGNEVYTHSGNASTNIVLQIDKELSQKMIPNIYSCSLAISGKDFVKELFSSKDCVLYVE